MYLQLTKNMVIFPYLRSDKFTVANTGEYILLDRWFNILIASEKQMEQLIKQDYKNFRRSNGKA